MARDNISIVDLDFDGTKESLKTFLKSQSTLTDYDFEGATINIILDLLAANTHYTAFLANSVINETFLSTAVKRKNVVSRAKELNYTPSSYTAPVATITVTLTNVPSNPITTIIEKGTKFATVVDNTTYTYSTTQDYILTRDSNLEYTGDIDIYEGTLLDFTYTYDVDNTQFLEVPSNRADMSTLSVNVRANESDPTEIEYAEYDSILELTPLSEIYYTQENDKERFEIYFGDNILGMRPLTGAIIRLNYLITNGEVSNGANLFSRVGLVGGTSDVVIVTTNSASGGSEQEDIETIRTIAPLTFGAQERAVTEQDYTAIVLRDYPSVENVSVWGGDRNDPPIYGRVFIATQPKIGTVLSNRVKTQIEEDIMEKYSIVGTARPTIVDADFTLVGVKTNVSYNSANSSITAGAIQVGVLDAIRSYFTTINSFNSSVSYSKLTTAIDNSNAFITGNSTDLLLTKFISPSFGLPRSYSVDYNNNIEPNSITSSEFVQLGENYILRDVPNDDGINGIIQIFRVVGEDVVIFNETAGTVVYQTGIITLSNFAPDSTNFTLDPFNIYITSNSSSDNLSGVFDYNVYTNDRDQILQLDEDRTTIDLIG